MFNQLTMGFK